MGIARSIQTNQNGFGHKGSRNGVHRTDTQPPQKKTHTPPPPRGRGRARQGAVCYDLPFGQPTTNCLTCHALPRGGAPCKQGAPPESERQGANIFRNWDEYNLAHSSNQRALRRTRLMENFIEFAFRRWVGGRSPCDPAPPQTPALQSSCDCAQQDPPLSGRLVSARLPERGSHHAPGEGTA